MFCSILCSCNITGPSEQSNDSDYRKYNNPMTSIEE